MCSISYIRLMVAVTLTALSCALPRSMAAAENAATDAWQNVNEYRRLSASDDARYEEKKGQEELQLGGLMIENLDDCTIKTGLSLVEPRRKSLVFVRRKPTCDHVFVLLGNTAVQVGAHVTQLNAGEELIVVGHDCKDPSEIFGDDSIGRRRLKMVTIPSGQTIGVAEFSLVQAMEREPVLYRLLHSTDNHDKALKERLLKTAAILHFVTGNHGQYMPPAH